jgi:hypothetical protein
VRLVVVFVIRISSVRVHSGYPSKMYLRGLDVSVAQG